MKKFAKVHHAALLSVSIVLVCMSFLWLDNAPAQTKVREGQVLFSATGHDHSGGANGNADLALDSLTVAGSVVATGTVYATGTITTAGDVTAGGDVSAGDDVIAGDDVRLSQGGMVILNSATDTATVSYNGTSIALSLGTTVAGNIESTSGDLIAFDDLIAGGDVVATGTITAASIEVSGNATAAYFIGNGSLLTGLSGGTLQAVTDAGKTTTNDITVAGITNNGTFTMGTNVATATGKFDANIYGYNAGLVADIPRLYWDASKGAIRSGYDTTGAFWSDANTGINSIAMGYNAKASAWSSVAMGNTVSALGNYSVAMGQNTTANGGASIALGLAASTSADAAVAIGANTASAQNASAFGYGTVASGKQAITLGKWVTSSADDAITIGSGVDGTANRLVNSTANSLKVGFNSTVPTLYVSSGSGAGTYGQVGIGTTSPLAGSLIDVEGVLNSASITSEGTIFATDTISSVAGFIASGSAGIDTSWTVCCTWNAFDCTATGTVTVTKGIITAGCP